MGKTGICLAVCIVICWFLWRILDDFVCFLTKTKKCNTFRAALQYFLNQVRYNKNCWLMRLRSMNYFMTKILKIWFPQFLIGFKSAEINLNHLIIIPYFGRKVKRHRSLFVWFFPHIIYHDFLNWIHSVIPITPEQTTKITEGLIVLMFRNSKCIPASTDWLKYEQGYRLNSYFFSYERNFEFQSEAFIWNSPDYFGVTAWCLEVSEFQIIHQFFWKSSKIIYIVQSKIIVPLKTTFCCYIFL